MRSDETLEKNTEHSQSIITSIWSKYIFTVAKMLLITCVDSYFTKILVLYYFLFCIIKNMLSNIL